MAGILTVKNNGSLVAARTAGEPPGFNGDCMGNPGGSWGLSGGLTTARIERRMRGIIKSIFFIVPLSTILGGKTRAINES